MTSRSPTAALSPVELTALRHIADGRTTEVSADHLQILLAMGLAGLDQNGGAALATGGQRRLGGAPAEQAAR
ncbi:MAG: hypothetical protein GEV13_08495 [Rhodospirillales bacterium]|nr:hypothetical protein [Rhodospirillales bacterium]